MSKSDEKNETSKDEAKNETPKGEAKAEQKTEKAGDSRTEQQEAVAGPMGGPDQYPYTDKTAMPLHERALPAVGRSPLVEATQAELNPAFYPNE